MADEHKNLAERDGRGFKRGLYFKATLLIGCVLIIAMIEVALALYFKNDLKQDFFRVSRFDDRERDFLRGIMISSEMAYELSIPERGMVFLKVSLWQKRLRDLANLERVYPDILDRGSNAPSIFDLSYKSLQRLLDSGANNEELGDFARNTKKSVNDFSEQLSSAVADLRLKRGKVVEHYGEKSDFYAWVLLIIGLNGFVFVVISGGLFLAKLLTALKQLEIRAKEISIGKYTQPLSTDRDDEIGELILSVNAMSTSLEQREREIEEFRRRIFQQEKMFTIGSFAAGLAHEVGNPIQALLALNTQAIESLIYDPQEKDIEQSVEALSLANEQIERLSGVVREIREFTHTGPLQKDLMDINEIVENTISLMRFDKRFKKLPVVVDLSKDIPAILGVGDHLAQVLINLLINAADAVDGDDGQIMVATRLENDSALLTVSDNGSGMSPDALDRALEPFFTTKEKGKGTGLGLAVCKQIIDDHDGEMTINSATGQGTMISVRLHLGEDAVHAGEGTE